MSPSRFALAALLVAPALATDASKECMSNNCCDAEQNRKSVSEIGKMCFQLDPRKYDEHCHWWYEQSGRAQRMCVLTPESERQNRCDAGPTFRCGEAPEGTSPPPPPPPPPWLARESASASAAASAGASFAQHE